MLRPLRAGLLMTLLISPVAWPGVEVQPESASKLLSLQVERSGPDLWVTWDAESAAVASAKSGKLTIDDGGTVKSLALDLEQLRSAAVLYSPTNGDVWFQLTVFAPEPVSESVRIQPSEAEPAPKLRLSTYVPPAPVRKEPVKMTVVQRSWLSRMGTPVIQIDVQVKLDQYGKVVDAKALSAADPLRRALASAAESAALQWQYTPARLNGEPITGTAVVSFRFSRPVQ